MIAGKSTAPSPGTVNAPLITASRKLQLRLRASFITAGRTSLQCTWHTRAMCLSSTRERIAAGERDVPGVEQQADGVARARHQLIDVGGRLDIRAHVMMIGERTPRLSV